MYASKNEKHDIPLYKRLYGMSTITYSHCSVYLPLYFFILPAGGRLGFGNSLHEVHQFLHQQSEENNSKTSQHFSHIWNQHLQIQNTASAVIYCSEMTYYYSNTTKQGCFSTSISSYVTMIKMTHALLKWLHFFSLNYDKNNMVNFSSFESSYLPICRVGSVAYTVPVKPVCSVM